MNPKSPKPIRTGHLSVEILLDRLTGRTADEASAPIEAHLERCARCRKELASVERLHTAMKADRAELPPEWARNQARSLVVPRPREVALPRRLMLTLRFDSWLAPAPARRSHGGTRRLLLGAPGVDVDLEIEAAPDGEGRVLRGQALPQGDEQWNEVSAKLVRPGARSAEARTAPRLAFRFDPLPSGTYRLVLSSGSREYVFPDLHL